MDYLCIIVMFIQSLKHYTWRTLSDVSDARLTRSVLMIWLGSIWLQDYKLYFSSGRSAKPHELQDCDTHLHAAHTHPIDLTSLSDPSLCCGGQLLTSVCSDFIVPCGGVDQMRCVSDEAVPCSEHVCQLEISTDEQRACVITADPAGAAP